MSTTPLNFGTSLEERLSRSIERFHRLEALIVQGLRVAVPGVVQSFSVGPPAVVSVQAATKELVTRNTGGETISLSTKAFSLPLLTDVPVCLPTGGGWALTLPIKAGDECVVLFSDTSLDAWLQSGGTANLQTSQRRHSLSDGMAIFGLRSQPRALTNYSTGSAQLRSDDGTVIIDLALSRITITAPAVTIDAPLKVSDGFGINGAAPQTGYATAGDVIATLPTNYGGWSFTTSDQFNALIALVNAMHDALLANGILSA